MRRGRIVVWTLALLLAGCSGGGGGGSSGSSNGGTGAPGSGTTSNAAASPGGIWHGATTAGETLTLLVAENGEFRSIENQNPSSGILPIFGTGTFSVDGSHVSSAYQRSHTDPISPTQESCVADGNLVERVSMAIDVTCTDANDNQTKFSATLVYDSDYTRSGSSLASIAGNYTLQFMPSSNVLNINGDGTIFGTYKNGLADCTVNGLVSIIDASYNFYRFEWHLSSCATASYEGVTLTGFGYFVSLGAPAGSFILVLSGPVGNHLEFASVLYEPA